MGAGVIVNRSETLRDLLIAGAGVMCLATTIVGPLLDSGQLVRVLPKFSVDPPHGIWLVTPARQHIPPRVAVVMDVVEEYVKGQQGAWDSVPH